MARTVFFASLLLGLAATASQATPLAKSASGSDDDLLQVALTAYTEQGAIPSATLAELSLPATSAFPTTDPTGLPVKDLKKLWAKVEAQLPVETAAVTTIQPRLSNFSLPADPPPILPSWVKSKADGLKFPKGFKYGVASAAQQVEGAAKADGRGPSTWDYLCHTWPTGCTNFTADVSDNSYYLYKQDHQRIKAMGVNTYSFTISWPRIYPFGNGEANEAGLKHYDDVIDDLLSQGIEPIVTLFHWDTPLSYLWETGAFFGKEIADDFATYAETVFKRFGDRVKTWVTFNEPRTFCAQLSGLPYSEVHHKFGVNATSAPYRCSYNLLRAHAKAVGKYRALVKSDAITSGEIALKSDDYLPVPYDADNPEDVRASKRHEAFYIGLFAEPVVNSGDYPEVVKDTIPADILPRFTDEEKAALKGTADFFPIDLYRINVAKAPATGIDACVGNITDPNWPSCQDVSTNEIQYTTSTGWAYGTPADVGSPWLWNTASHVRDQFKFLSKKYPVKGGYYISEYGFSEPFESERSDLYIIKKDAARSHYFLDYLNAVLLAIHEDGIDVRGTFAWSILDNFEWASGLNTRFGMQYVNFSDPALTRTYKQSFFEMKNFFSAHGIS